MKVRFNGVVSKHSKGCIPCGKAKSEIGFVRTKDYILPSGVMKTFRVGQIVDVADEDGEFLLEYKYTDKNGKTKNVFEVVNG